MQHIGGPLKKFLKSSKEIFIPFSFLLFTVYLFGYFEIPLTDSLGYGYGYYKANLLSLFNPVSAMNSFSWSNCEQDYDLSFHYHLKLCKFDFSWYLETIYENN